MFLGAEFRLVCVLVCALLFLICSNTNAQQVAAPNPSDPVALAVVKDMLNSFGDDVYHCKWEYDAERLQDKSFENGTKNLHIEGQWSFSAKLGSSYKFKYGDVEYIIREVEGSDNKILAFWPEATDQGQKFRMHLAPYYNNAFQGDMLTLHGMFSPCVLRWHMLMDKWGNPSVFGLNMSDGVKTVISINPLRKNQSELITLQTNDGIQVISEKWEVTTADPDNYKRYQGTECEKVFTNVRVNKVWLPSEVTFKRIQETGLLGTKSAFETAQWKLVGKYTVNKDTSMFRNIVPPDGTLFYDEFTYKNQRIGTWKRTEKPDEPRDNAFAKELQQLPDTPASATTNWYPTGRSKSFYGLAATLLVVGIVFVAVKTMGFRLRQR